MRFISAEQVIELLDFTGLVEALKLAHAGPVPIMDHLDLENRAGCDEDCENFLVLPAWLPGEGIGVKSVSVMPGNRRREDGPPVVQGVYLLFDGRDGRPLAAIDGAALTARKTAADSATGASYLAREDARVLLMVGAGAMAAPLIEAHVTIRPAINEISIWNRSAEKAVDLAKRIDDGSRTVKVSSDLEALVRRADIVSCATAATSPLIFGEWLKPGCHLDLVGGFRPDMRESDDDVVRRARLYVDSRTFTLGRVGDLTTPMASGVISQSDIIADLFELARGDARGRETDDEITFFKNGGGSHLDLFTARHLMTLLDE